MIYTQVFVHVLCARGNRLFGVFVATDCPLGQDCAALVEYRRATYVGREGKSKKKKYQFQCREGGKADTWLGQAGEDACSSGHLG